MEGTQEEVVNPAIRNETRNPDGTFKPGISGNPSGRPKGTMKDYISRKFRAMSDEEKELWLNENKLSAIDIWKMGEGNPANNLELSGELTSKVISVDE